jgi:signal transduction histidine kinase
MPAWAKWLAWGAILAVLAAAAAWGLRALVDWPATPLLAATLGLAGVVLAGASLRSVAVARSADAALVHTISVAGLLAVVAVAFVVALLLAGRIPDEGERRFLAMSLVAVAVAALLYRALQPRIAEAAARLVYGERHASVDLARSFGSRLTRSIPLDELVLQAAESLRSALGLRAAEVWTLGEGELRPWIGDPGIDRDPVSIGGMDPVTVVQAGLSGHGWMRIWLPELLEGREDSHVRMAPMAHAGELLGIVVVERPVRAKEFASEDERTLVELARQLGLALHNTKLDSALQASLVKVQRQADELQASRGRIVAAGDQARRRIERDLHDGAQQHLVALAVQVRLARQVLERDPGQAAIQLEGVATAVDETLQELRDLAHGIYPPLLADKGLPDALASAARRAVLPVAVLADGVGRYGPEAEATVYFCCLEALQNAGKYAGEGASATVEVREEESGLVFVVTDDGAGFDVRGRDMGAGFANMHDRLGALGGTLRIESAPGRGTRVTGVVPVPQSRDGAGTEG